MGLKLYPTGSDGKESACNAGHLGSIPGLGRSPGEGNDNPLQCSCLDNPMDRGAWKSTVHGVKKNWTRLSKATKHTHLKKKKRWGAKFIAKEHFPGSPAGKESACNAGDSGLIPGSRRSPGEGIGSALQYSWASLVAQPMKNLPAMWETWV